MDTNETAGSRGKAIRFVLELCELSIMLLLMMWLRTSENYGLLPNLAALAYFILYGLYRREPRRETATADTQREESRGPQNAAAANWPTDEHSKMVIALQQQAVCDYMRDAAANQRHYERHETDDEQTEDDWTTDDESDEGRCREGYGGREYSVEYSSDEEYSNMDSDDDSDATVQFDGQVDNQVGVAVAA
ncbi:hypothetical protein CPLU01_12014 [Colletotrichum plurivorum]|uniref:Uncharacterized protein n=1 Tax=Colletotrichum plurivorum TaxID=2175906 RepID=A0A8H6JZR3_9PEZI|nr:hypothetical protein CPLU01_12014 [Colletotrichum plurivorum]